jgi:hypothetical protein
MYDLWSWQLCCADFADIQSFANENLKEEDSYEGLDIDGKVILKWDLKE